MRSMNVRPVVSVASGSCSGLVSSLGERVLVLAADAVERGAHLVDHGAIWASAVIPSPLARSSSLTRCLIVVMRFAFAVVLAAFFFWSGEVFRVGVDGRHAVDARAVGRDLPRCRARCRRWRA